MANTGGSKNNSYSMPNPNHKIKNIIVAEKYKSKWIFL